jgi:hypothetical protein
MLYRDAGLDMEAPQQSQLDFSRVPHIFGVPRYLFRKAAVTLGEMVAAAVRREPVTRFERETWLWFFAGIFVQRWKDRGSMPPAPAVEQVRPPA